MSAWLPRVCIGLAVLQRLKPFDVKLHYTDRHRLPALAVEKELGLTFHPTAGEMVPFCDVVTINAPLHPETEEPLRRRDDRADEARDLSGEQRGPTQPAARTRRPSSRRRDKTVDLIPVVAAARRP